MHICIVAMQMHIFNTRGRGNCYCLRKRWRAYISNLYACIVNIRKIRKFFRLLSYGAVYNLHMVGLNVKSVSKIVNVTIQMKAF